MIPENVLRRTINSSFFGAFSNMSIEFKPQARRAFGLLEKVWFLEKLEENLDVA